MAFFRTEQWQKLSAKQALVRAGRPDRSSAFTPILLQSMAATRGRPARGPGVVYWEDIYVSADANNFQATANRVPLDGNGQKQVLCLPEGDFFFNSWDKGTGGNNGIGIGTNGAGGIDAIFGSGRGTVIKPITNATAAPRANMASNQQDWPGAQMMRVSSVSGFVLSNVAFARPTQLYPYNQCFMLDACHNSRIEWSYWRGAAPGFNNTPPGETFSINVFKSNDVTIDYVEIDGRDAAGTRVGASPIGWNGTGNYGTHGSSISFAQRAKTYRTYLHHGLTGMHTWWKTQDIYTEDLWVYSTMSGTGAFSGHCLNHEQSKGPVLHVRPRLYTHGKWSGTTIPAGIPGAGGTEAVTTASNTTNDFSGAMALRSTIQDLGAVTTVIDPRWDRAYINGLGAFMYLGSAGYGSSFSGGDFTNGDTNLLATDPEVTLANGVQLTQHTPKHPGSGWYNADPATEMAVVT